MKKMISKKDGRRIMASILAVVLLFFSVQTSPALVNAAKKKKVTSVSITKPFTSTLTLKKGRTYTLKTKVLPKNAKNKRLKYKSSKASVVSVSSKGKLKAKKVGSAKITVTARDGSKKKSSITVTVVKKLKKVTKVSLTPSSKTLYVGGAPAEATVKLRVKLQPKNATNKKVSYVSSSKSVATVDSKGNVKAKKTGTAKIIAYAKDGQGAKGTCKVKVEGKKKTVVVTPAPTLEPNSFAIAFNKEGSSIYLDAEGKDYKGLNLVAKSFANDVKLIANVTPDIVTDTEKLGKMAIVVGSIGNNKMIDQLITTKKIDASDITGKREVYKISVVKNPAEGVGKALVIVGSDKRGAIYGLYHISEMMGISPWVYWGDVNPKKRDNIYYKDEEFTAISKEPSVKYRGIFLNDEQPSLHSWISNKFKGRYNEEFYGKVYELILRLKGNYLWPAMWSPKFSMDGTSTPLANAELADAYGIVMGTSHHEPMMRASEEWSAVKGTGNYGNGEWSYINNKDGLLKFWDEAVVRNGKLENLITLGIRGEADSPMLPTTATVEDNVNLLKDIITDQKNILKNHNLKDNPKVLTLYKEVEEFWYGSPEVTAAPEVTAHPAISGLKEWDVLDDVTIMLTEDNFGNLRTLPTIENRNREAGWGMYYHFDYHGGPRSYEWVNTIQAEKVWEQMSMAYDYGVKDVWIVNVGDLKPMELPISYFLDMAYDFDKWGTNNISSTETYIREWTKEQFGNYTDAQGINDIVSLLNGYTKLNGSRKPEIVSDGTYSVTSYNEAIRKLSEINDMIALADKYKAKLPAGAQAAFYQLVYYPAVASANVHRMQIYAGFNATYYAQGRTSANVYAELVKEAIQMDKDLQKEYNENMPGVKDKWKGMMSSVHVGYANWNAEGASYPSVKYLGVDETSSMLVYPQGDSKVYKSGTAALPEFTNGGNEVYSVDVANAGGNAFDYTVETDKDWIKVTKTSGNVLTQDTFGVSVDFTKLTEDAKGNVTIKGTEKEVKIAITAKVTSEEGLDPMTFIEANDYISIEAAHFTDSKSGEDESSWKEIKNYGKTLSSIKVFPTTRSFEDSTKAPYVEYKVKAVQAGEYTLQTYVAPSNNVDWDYVSMKYGVSVNGGEVVKVDSLDSKNFRAGVDNNTSSWKNDVMENCRISKSKVTLVSGVNTIRIYAVDAALVLQKLVLYPTDKPLDSSFFGPEESYYVGKTVTPKLVADIQKGLYTAACTMPATTDNKYELVIAKAIKHEVRIEASSQQSVTVDALWNGEKIGEIVVNGEGVFSMKTTSEMEKGKGVLSLDVGGKAVTVKNVSMIPLEVKNIISIDINASSEDGENKVENVYDGNSLTSWKPTSVDTTPYIEFDMKQELSFDRISLSEVGSNVEAYEIRTTSNGMDWKTVYVGASIESDEVIYLQGKEELIGTKVRVVFTKVKGAPTMSEVILTPYINWARKDNEVTLSGQDMVNNKPFTVDKNVVDGDRITKALVESLGGNTGKKPYVVEMSFGEIRTIDHINLISLQMEENTSAGTGIIPTPSMISNLVQVRYTFSYYNGKEWIELGTIEQSEEMKRKVLNILELEQPVDARKIKVDVYTSNWVRICELEAVQTMKMEVATKY